MSSFNMQYLWLLGKFQLCRSWMCVNTGKLILIILFGYILDGLTFCQFLWVHPNLCFFHPTPCCYGLCSCQSPSPWFLYYGSGFLFYESVLWNLASVFHICGVSKLGGHMKLQLCYVSCACYVLLFVFMIQHCHMDEKILNHQNATWYLLHLSSTL